MLDMRSVIARGIFTHDDQASKALVAAQLIEPMIGTEVTDAPHQ